MLLRKGTTIMAILVGEVSALEVLHRLGSYGPAIRWGDVGRWLAETPPEDAIVVVVRLVALVIAWWLTATTVLYTLASAARMTTLVGGLRWATLPPVRRVIDGLLASTIVVGTTLGPAQVAVAQSNHGDPIVVRAGQGDVAHDATGNLPRPLGHTSPERHYQPAPAGDAAAPSGIELATSSPRTSPSPSTYVVQRNDSLWRIAEHQCGPVNDATIRIYWIRLVKANIHRLASGKPDLIYPDEVVDLPGSA